jgi:hypothetical protein
MYNGTDAMPKHNLMEAMLVTHLVGGNGTWRCRGRNSIEADHGTTALHEAGRHSIADQAAETGNENGSLLHLT